MHRPAVVALAFVLAGCTGLTQLNTVDAAARQTATAALNAHASLVADVAGPDQTMDLADARHLASRTGFGLDTDTVARWVGRSRHEAVDELLSTLRTEAVTPPPRWTENYKPRHWQQVGFTQPELQAFNRARSREIADIRRWWIAEMITTPSPLTEKLTLFWHDHFVSSFEGTGRWSHALYDQNVLFRAFGAGNYRSFLRQMVRDPALLVYLDNTANQVGAPNENLARELLELFTLGEGHYTEADVQAAARTLSGWGVRPQSNYGFERKPWAVDTGEKTLFGQSGAFDADDLIDIILARPEASTHLTRKFWALFVSSTSENPDTIASIAAVFRRSEWDLRALYAAILKSEDFWSDTYRGTLVKTPADLVLGLARTFGHHSDALDADAHRLRLLGQETFQHANVSGWPDGLDWLTPDMLAKRTLVIRNWLAERSAGAAALPTDTDTDTPSMMMAASTAPLSVRVAGEAFDGPPSYRVSVKVGGTLVDVGAATVPFSHDTAVYGGVDNVETELTWSVQRFELTVAPEDVTGVVIEYEHDAAHPDGANHGDRNLFVSWAEVDGRRLDADRGVKTGCGPNQPAALWCAGSLTLDIDTSALPAANNTAAAAEDLAVEDIHFVWWDNPLDTDRDWVQMQFTLYRPRYQGRSWRNLDIALVRSPAVGGLALMISSDGCHPACFNRWPDEHWFNDDTQNHSIVIGSAPLTGDFAEHVRGLSADDQALVSLVLRHTADIHSALTRDLADRSPTATAEAQAWLAEFDRFNQALDLTAMAPVQGTLFNENTHGTVAHAGTLNAAPERDWQSPTKHTPVELADWPSQLPAVLADTDLRTLLLATPAVDMAPTDNTLSAILRDPAYQVH